MGRRVAASPAVTLFDWRRNERRYERTGGFACGLPSGRSAGCAICVPDGLAVIWGFGQKKVFPLELLPDARIDVQRAQMVDAPASPIEIAPTSDTDGLQALFSDRLVKVLVRAGFGTRGAVQRATDGQLQNVGGIGPTTLREIRELLPAGGD
jgi:hypothetical protein